MREQAIMPWLYEKVGEYEDVDKEKPVSYLIGRLQHHEGEENQSRVKLSPLIKELVPVMEDAKQLKLDNFLKRVQINSNTASQIEQAPDEIQKLENPMHSCIYHDYLLSVKKENPLVAAIGDKQTNELTQKWLRETIVELEWPFYHRGGKALEVMAGIGLNYPLLKQK